MDETLADAILSVSDAVSDLGLGKYDSSRSFGKCLLDGIVNICDSLDCINGSLQELITLAQEANNGNV